MLDYILDKYRNGVFELFNYIARKLDQVKGEKGFGEKIIKNSLEEFDRIIEERKNNKTDEWKLSSSKLKQVTHFILGPKFMHSHISFQGWTL